MKIQIVCYSRGGFVLSYKDFARPTPVQLADYIAIKLNDDEVFKLELKKG